MAEPTKALMRMRGREELARWSLAMERSRAPLFATLYRAIAEDDALYALSLEAPPEQLSGRLLIAAVHYLLLGAPDHPLTAYFPSITPQPLPAAHAGRPFAAFCQERRAALVEILKTRTLQTTLADRAAQLLLPFNHVAAAIGAPFSLIEVGCSAGLLLAFDHYRYEFPGGQSVGPKDAEVVVSGFGLVGEAARIPTAFPAIRRRTGLDLNPVDVTDVDARNWILGCSSADRVDKFNALRTALEYRARVPMNIVAGDAMRTLPPALTAMDGPVCIYHSRCLYQWPLAAQDAFSAMLKRLSLERPLHRIGIEWSGDPADPSATEGGSQNDISHTIYRDGESHTQRLGKVTHKSRIEWFAEAA